MGIERHIYPMEEIFAYLFTAIPEAEELYLFGSRMHRTRSERSDIDLLLKHSCHIKQSFVREVSDPYPALDIFLVENSKAVSVINDSYIQFSDFNSLLIGISAVKVWDRSQGKINADIDWEMRVRSDVNYTKTVLPNLTIPTAGEYLDSSLVRGTRTYITKIVRQINDCHARGIWDGCAVLSRRLVETLIIEVYESKGRGNEIKTGSDYMMFSGLIDQIVQFDSPSLSRNVKAALPKIKDIGDKSAHGRFYTAKFSDLEAIKTNIRDSVECLVEISGLQDSTPIH